MASPPYKLSCALFGHTLDVRSVAVTLDGCIVSGSRDKTAKIWTPNGTNAGYSDSATLVGHSNFVSAVCYIPPDDLNRNGLVLTGSVDTAICVFDLLTSKLLYKLQGHSSNVCCLSAGGSGSGSALSGSWDATARRWKLDGSSKPLTTLVGHQAAVWSVIQLANGLTVTGSADKAIKVWSAVADCLITLQGHTDCVRGLAPTSDFTFLSASNDASVRHWNATTGACLGTFYAHTNYIYSVSAMGSAGADCFVTSGEDRTVRVWRAGECQQVLALPAQSVWSVGFLPNGDIVAGSSDGMVRVFSDDPRRYADPPVLQAFEEEVAAVAAAQQQDLGGINVSQLPGMDCLSEPGTKDGQTKMVRDGNAVYCYGWSEAEREWNKIGDVMGASGGTQATSGKQLHEGKEYDYVFNVDIEEGCPPLRLPYNAGDDPWAAAQKFIHAHDLSQAFLEQVANFIVANSAKTNVPVQPLPSEFGDPLTGGNRYIPGESTVGAPGADPFTGANRYVPPGGSANLPAATSAASTNGGASAADKPYFPQQAYLSFDLADMQVILDKLVELSGKAGDGTTEAQLAGVCQLAGADAEADLKHAATLRQLLQWPPDLVLPVLDVTRLAIRGSRVNGELCSGAAGERLCAGLLEHAGGGAAGNAMMAVRVACNMMRHPAGEALALAHCDQLVGAVGWRAKEPPTKNMQVAMATLLINLAVGMKRCNRPASRPAAVLAAAAALPRLTDPEAQFRGLVALGTLVCDADSASEQAALKGAVRGAEGAAAALERLAARYGAVLPASKEGKAANCAAQVLALMQM